MPNILFRKTLSEKLEEKVTISQRNHANIDRMVKEGRISERFGRYLIELIGFYGSCEGAIIFAEEGNRLGMALSLRGALEYHDELISIGIEHLNIPNTFLGSATDCYRELIRLAGCHYKETVRKCKLIQGEAA